MTKRVNNSKTEKLRRGGFKLKGELQINYFESLTSCDIPNLNFEDSTSDGPISLMFAIIHILKVKARQSKRES